MEPAQETTKGKFTWVEIAAEYSTRKVDEIFFCCRKSMDLLQIFSIDFNGEEKICNKIHSPESSSLGITK